MLNAKARRCNISSTNVEAEDICSTPVITCFSVDATNDCTRTRTLFYTATDACGNSASCMQVVTWTVTSGVSLSIAIDGSNVVISWPANCNMFRLQQTSSLDPTAWTNVAQPVVVVNNRNTVTVPASGSNTFYRLIYP